MDNKYGYNAREFMDVHSFPLDPQGEVVGLEERDHEAVAVGSLAPLPVVDHAPRPLGDGPERVVGWVVGELRDREDATLPHDDLRSGGRGRSARLP